MNSCTAILLEVKIFPGRSITNNGDKYIMMVSDVFGREFEKI